MLEELKMILELLGDLGVYAVWVAVAYFVFKLVTLASYVLLAKYVAMRLFDYLTSEKKEVFKLDEHFIDNAREPFLAFIESLKEPSSSYNYIHASDIAFARKAIQEKRERDSAKK